MPRKRRISVVIDDDDKLVLDFHASRLGLSQAAILIAAYRYCNHLFDDLTVQNYSEKARRGTTDNINELVDGLVESSNRHLSEEQLNLDFYGKKLSTK